MWGEAPLPDARELETKRLMSRFATATGLVGEAAPRRYLWTDAHAVCNFLSLHARAPDERWLELAILLVEQVHQVLGRHRPDDARTGWISTLSEEEGRAHPTIGGLRIGKPEPERPLAERFDERKEWTQDGQYFHYLTKWMHALGRMAEWTADMWYLQWASELAIAAHRGFRAPAAPARLYWKMSIDLRYPLVAASGQHDPLDGLISTLELCDNAPSSLTRLMDPVVSDLATMCSGRSWTTDDPLGIGGLLFDAMRICQIQSPRGKSVALPLLDGVLDAAMRGLDAFAASGTLQLPAAHRLAFREFGVSIGLQVIDDMCARGLPAPTNRQLDRLGAYAPLRDRIERFWMQPDRQQVQAWTDHQDINSVMLATSLASNAYLKRRSRSSAS